MVYGGLMVVIATGPVFANGAVAGEDYSLIWRVGGLVFGPPGKVARMAVVEAVIRWKLSAGSRPEPDARAEKSAVGRPQP